MPGRARELFSFVIAAGLALAVSVQAVQSGPPPQSLKGTGAILGQVVDSVSGQPIAEAVVTLNSAPPQRVLTDERGRFLFHGLRNGSIAIEVTAPGYLSGAPHRGTLAEGQLISDLKIRLAKFAVVSGTVFDDAGEPVAGISVYFTRPGVVGYGAVSTDDRGRYRRVLAPGDTLLAVLQSRTTIPTEVSDAAQQALAAASMLNRESGGGQPGSGGIRIGDFVVSGSAPVISSNGRLLANQSIYYASAVTQAQASVITLQPGEERTGVDFHLRLVPTSSVSGIVTGPSGPAKNAVVELVPVASDVTSAFGISEATARTRDDGSFTFLAVPEGPYNVRVIRTPATLKPDQLGPPELAQVMTLAMGAMGEDVDSKVLLFAEAPVVVADADIIGVTLTLRAGIRVTGRLEFDGTQPAPSATQLRSFSVSLLPVGRTGLGGFREPDVGVDDDGRFKTAGKVSGRHWLHVEPGSSAARQWVVKAVLVAGRDVTNDGVELKDADVNDARVILTNKTGTVSGSVRGSDGRPPAGVSVLLIPGGYDAWIGNADVSRLRVRRIALTVSGTYSFDALPAGEYRVAAVADEAILESAAFYRAMARAATAVTLGESERKTQDLQVVKVAR